MFLWVQKRLAPAELPGPSETVLCRYRCIPRFCVRLRSCWSSTVPDRTRPAGPGLSFPPVSIPLEWCQASHPWPCPRGHWHIPSAHPLTGRCAGSCAVVKERIIVVHCLTIASMAAAASGQREKNLFLQRSALASAAFSHRSARCLSCWRPYTLLSYRLLSEFKAS